MYGYKKSGAKSKLREYGLFYKLYRPPWIIRPYLVNIDPGIKNLRIHKEDESDD
ncbi:hypothetical protein YWY31_42960 [Paenibacillus illinoisensis]